MKEASKILSNFSLHITPEYLKECAKNCYNEDREYPENFSNWYKYIEDFGNFYHTLIINNQIFTFDEIEIMCKTDNIDNVDWDSINQILKPTLEKMKDNTIYNIKNGCFSNKFDFNTSLATKENLAKQLWSINYMSSLYETGGYTELVVRELIPNTINTTLPTIYNGMPLREEIRVFYNIDTQQIVYMVDYWEYEYCNDRIENTEDNHLFKWFHNIEGDRKINHLNKLKELYKRIEHDIKTLKINNSLKGIWSIDFLWEENENKIYLIDMARGFRSAYWNLNKVSEVKVNEKDNI